jgi:hypothetical protein
MVANGNRSRNPIDNQRRNSHNPIITEDLFITEFQTLGPRALARKYGIRFNNIMTRRRYIESKLGIVIQPPQENLRNNTSEETYRQEHFPGRLNMSIQTGVVLVGGDAHYWPGRVPLMHRAFLAFIKEFRSDKVLRAVIANGDVTDFAAISRWPQVDWEKRPSVKDEIDTCVDRMGEIEEACGGVEKLWPLGNHDARFSMYVAAHADRLEGIEGVHLKDHFPLWKPCWSVEINDGFETCVVKHTFKGGMYAPRNNVLNAGCHFVTNHLHSAKVMPITMRHHTFYGVDTGCIADIYGPQFLYCQDNPRDWRSAFAVLTFHKGKLLMPELVLAVDEKHIQFRGEVKRI